MENVIYKKIDILKKTKTINDEVFLEVRSITGKLLKKFPEKVNEIESFITHYSMALMRLVKQESTLTMDKELFKQVLLSPGHTKAKIFIESEMNNTFFILTNYSEEEKYLLIHLSNIFT